MENLTGSIFNETILDEEVAAAEDIVVVVVDAGDLELLLGHQVKVLHQSEARTDANIKEVSAV